MPYSDPDNKALAAGWLTELSPATVLDVGPGAGAYGKLVRSLPGIERVDAIEAWESYIPEFGLTSIYDSVFVGDVRHHTDFRYDVVIFGDVLEHMTREEALAVYELAREQAEHILFSIPIIHLPQGAYAGNPFEVDVEEDWSHDEVLDWFPGIYKAEKFRVTGLYLAR